MPLYRKVRSHDGHVELDEMKATCVKHKELCRQFAECSREMRQNEGQLEILAETGNQLKDRHAAIKGAIAGRGHSQAAMAKLEEEVDKVDREVTIWMKELEEVNAQRIELEIRCIRLGAELKKSITSVQLASIDFDLIHKKHEKYWQRFLAEQPSSVFDEEKDSDNGSKTALSSTCPTPKVLA
ncbi:hypothetical protein WR25_01587 [Diploscapter pachys]|uniref:Uncharacterized protein n=1 Tax=Diploscapter pachys TaxID=2018661 RepID=A0A2A2KQ81_9BILA|nr:hypothetical protein WR25_01587 [Diploscapter pachys]